MKKGFIVVIVLAAVAWFGVTKLLKMRREKEAESKPPVTNVSVPPGKAAAEPPKAKELPSPAAKAKASPLAQAPAKASTPAAKAAPSPVAGLAPKETLQELSALAAKGGADKEKAWGILTRKFLTASSDAERQEAKKLLDEVSADLMFSKTPTSFAESYVVQRGDTLHDIANKYNTTVGLIRWGSQKARDIIRPGEKLKIPVGKVKLILQKSRFRLIVLFNNNYVKEYVVAIGRAEKTPNGTFIIDEKVVNPNWYAPDGKVYKYGEEKNILGTRWMRFKETSQFAGFGIHGTTQEDTVGKPASEGCIRMRNKEVEELFDVVPRGTEVVISE
jgi:lipoprotein-anchoring transpeptidase ErfK/SrfK